MFEKIAQMLFDQKNINPDSVRPESSFEDMGFDSLDMLEFAMAIESEFGITLDSTQISTVGELEELIISLENS